MLLKKLEENGKITATYSSSNICASIYDKATKALTITFNNGGQYQYSDVSLTDYTRFELADSQGAVFNSHLTKYTFENLGKVDTAGLLLEVTQLKEAEDKKKIEDATIIMVHKMQTFLDVCNNKDNTIGGGYVSLGLLDKVEDSIKAYRAVKK